MTEYEKVNNPTTEGKKNQNLKNRVLHFLIFAAASSLALLILAFILGGLLAVGLIAALLYTLFGGYQNTQNLTLSKRSKGKSSRKGKSKKCRTSGRSSSKRRKRNHSSGVQSGKAVPPPPSRLDSRFGKIISNLVLNVSVSEPSKSDLDADKFADKASKTPKVKLGQPIKANWSSLPKLVLTKKNGTKSAWHTRSHSRADPSHSAGKTRRVKMNRRHNSSGTHTTVRSKD